MSQMELTVESGDAFSVRNIEVNEGISELFYISIWARSELSALDFETLIGKSATLSLTSGLVYSISPMRRWKGVCERIEQVECEAGDSLYHVTLVPKLWLLTQRTNHRVFQHKTVQDIVKQLLDEWGVEHEWKIDAAAYPKLEIRIQYGESDFDFLSYLLEEAGIAYLFKDDPKKGTIVWLTDALSAAEERKLPLPFVHNANESSELEHVTEVRMTRTLRAGKVTLRDVDFRRGPRTPVVGVTEPIPQKKSESNEGQKEGQAQKEDKRGIEDRFERYHFAPGSSLLEVDASKAGLSYPVGDKQGIARYQDEYEKRMATVELESRRAIATDIRFDTNAVDIAPGSIFRVLNHPRLHLISDLKLLVLESTLEHTVNEEIEMRCRAIDAQVHYRPDRKTSRPVIRGVQSAVVVGPEKEEIFTDEFGRVKVQFFWDREGKFNENSSCWLRVAFGAAGPGFGRMAIPRVGHEVFVAFFEGNPDEPVIVGSAYNGTAPVPHQQPGHKTRSTWRTQSYPGGGGANEWMMDDAKGQELVYLLAERDHTRTVKQDHATAIGRIDSTLVGDKLHWHIDGSATGIEMVDNRITLTTGDASIVLNGSEIAVSAKGTITLKSAGNDVVLQGGPMVKINVGNSAGVSKLKADATAPKATPAPAPERKRLPLLPGQKPCVKLGVNKKYKDAILLASQRTGMPPESIAAIMNAEAEKNKQGEWNPNSYNTDSHAQGLTQFIPGTWNQMAKQKGTLLNERAQELGYVKEVTTKRGTSYQVVPGKEQELLDLRTDPELSIVSAAEYDSENMKALDDAGLLPAGLTDDERAQYSYLTHHEGSGGAKQILNGKLTDARARKLFPGQVGKKKADELIAAEGGDAAGAYKKWLWGYTKQKVTPDKYRCSDEAVDGDESPEAKAAAANPPPKKSKKK